LLLKKYQLGGGGKVFRKFQGAGGNLYGSSGKGGGASRHEHGIFEFFGVPAYKLEKIIKARMGKGSLLRPLFVDLKKGNSCDENVFSRMGSEKKVRESGRVMHNGGRDLQACGETQGTTKTVRGACLET